MSLGKRLATLRAQQGGKSQVTVARELSALAGRVISRGAYSLWELDEREPDHDTLALLARYYRTTVDYLLGRMDDPQTAQEDRATYLAERWPNLSPENRERAAKLAAMPGANIGPDAEDIDIEILWAAVNAAIASSEATKKAAGNSGGSDQ